MSSSEIQATVNHAGAAIITLAPHRWAGWVIYLMEALENETMEREADPVDAFLADVRRDLGQRIEGGQW